MRVPEGQTLFGDSEEVLWVHFEVPAQEKDTKQICESAFRMWDDMRAVSKYMLTNARPRSDKALSCYR